MADDDDVKLSKYETYMFWEPLHTIKPSKKHIGKSRKCEVIENLAAPDDVSFGRDSILPSTGDHDFVYFFT